MSTTTITTTTASTVLDHIPLTPGGSVGQLQPLRRPGSHGHTALSPSPGSFDGDQYPAGRYSPNVAGAVGTPADTGVEDQRLTAEKLLHTEVYSGHDALKLLFEAAGRSGDIRLRDDSQPQVKTSPATAQGSVDVPAMNGKPVGNAVVEEDGGRARPYAHRPESKLDLASVPIDPAIRNAGPFPLPPSNDEAEPDAERVALKAWASCRFVRAGWFTAREAMEYIE